MNDLASQTSDIFFSYRPQCRPVGLARMPTAVPPGYARCLHKQGLAPHLTTGCLTEGLLFGPKRPMPRELIGQIRIAM